MVRTMGAEVGVDTDCSLPEAIQHSTGSTRVGLSRSTLIAQQTATSELMGELGQRIVIVLGTACCQVGAEAGASCSDGNITDEDAGTSEHVATAEAMGLAERGCCSLANTSSN